MEFNDNFTWTEDSITGDVDFEIIWTCEAYPNKLTYT